MVKGIKRLLRLVLFVAAIYFLVQLVGFLFPVRYNETAEKYSKVNNLEINLVYGIINAESRFNSSAISGKDAEGLMQIKKDTAIWCLDQMGEDNKEIDLLDPETNIKIGTWYFAYLKQELGSEELAVIAYNAGISNVKNWLDEGIVDSRVTNPDNIPFAETKKYIKKVRIYRKVYEIIGKVTEFKDKIKIPGGTI